MGHGGAMGVGRGRSPASLRRSSLASLVSGRYLLSILKISVAVRTRGGGRQNRAGAVCSSLSVFLCVCVCAGGGRKRTRAARDRQRGEGPEQRVGTTQPPTPDLRKSGQWRAPKAPGKQAASAGYIAAAQRLDACVQGPPAPPP